MISGYIFCYLFLYIWQSNEWIGGVVRIILLINVRLHTCVTLMCYALFIIRGVKLNTYSNMNPMIRLNLTALNDIFTI